MRKLLILVAVLALAAGGLSPLALAGKAKAATALDWTDARGPGNGDAPALAMDNTHHVLYRGTGTDTTSARGVWKYQGGTWTSLGGAVSSYGITSLAYDDIGNKLYAGTNGAGVWCYDVAGGTWSDIAILDIHAYYNTAMAWGGGKLYVGCWDPKLPPSGQGKGVWCYDPSAPDPKWSDTGGGVSTWRIVSLVWGDGKLYAGCIDRSSDETAKGVWCYDPASGLPDKWSDVSNAFIGASYIYSMAWDNIHQLLYVGGPNVDLFSYDPDGSPDKWSDLREYPAYGITSFVYDTDHQCLFAGKYNQNNGDYLGVWRYDPGSPSPTKWSDTGGGVSTFSVTSLAYDTYHDHLFAGTSGQGVWRYNPSSNPATWSNTGGGVTTSGISAVVYDDTHNLLYAGTHGYGVWCYNPVTKSWSDTGGGVSTFSVTSLAYDTYHDHLFAGTSGQGVWRYNPSSNPATWSNTGGGVSTFRIPSLVWDPGRNRLYAGTGEPGSESGAQGVWCYDPAGGTWTDISADDVNTFNINSLALGADLLYAGCFDPASMTYVGAWSYDPENPGSGWTSTEGGVSTFRAFSMEWAGDRLYANCRGASYPDVEGLWCYDPSDGTWTEISGPGMITLRIYSMAWDGSKLYVSCIAWGTGALEGVWCYNPSDGTWTDTGGSMSTMFATSFAYDAGHKKLYSGTSSQGVWYADTRAAPTVTSVTPNSGAAGTTVSITDLKGTGFYGTPLVKLERAGQTDITATNVSVVSSTKITCKFNLANAALGTWNLYVENPDGQKATRSNAFTVNSCSSTWYLPEGSSAWGFDTWVQILNPNGRAVTCAVTYLTDTGPVSGPDINMAAESRATICPGEFLGARDFSTKVQCKEGLPIAVDRTMYWFSPAGTGLQDCHSSIGVTAPAKKWYLPEGSSAWGFECWLLIQNPNASEADCTVTYMVEGAAPITRTKTVPPNSRRTFNMKDDIGEKDASIEVTGNVPVIPERAMYRDERKAGHDSIGTTTPATSYYLAEGTSAWGFTTYVLVQNPNARDNTVTVTYMTGSGPKAQAPFTMGPNSRKTIKVNDVLPDADFSTRVQGTLPLIAERAMYWNRGSGEAMHDSIGMSKPHTTFYLPDGEAEPDQNHIETWTLVQNPNPTAVRVQITYVKDNSHNVSFTETIPASSRRTFNMADKVTGMAGIIVTSKTAGKKIMVERAMYWENGLAGTDTIGGFD